MGRYIGSLCTVLFIFFVIQSCEKKPTEFRKFLDGKEITYPGKVLDVQANPGYDRIQLTWLPGSDPKVEKYIVYWNGKKDSVVLNTKATQMVDTVKVYIDNLPEDSYSFQIYSINDKGDRSVPVSIENVKNYGSSYQSSLLNRSVASVNYLGSNHLAVNWGTADTINVYTTVKYINTSDQVKTITLKADADELIIPDWKYLSEIEFKSAYIPVVNAIDTLSALKASTINFSENILEVSKPWIALKLPYDANTYSTSTTLNWLWDGMPDVYPRIFHTANGSTMPHVFSFDLGRVYTTLTQFEEWGRQDPANRPFSNPIDFEVWGIADTTNALPGLPPTDPGWKNETIDKGWTLLSEVIRSDNGIGGIKVNLVNNPPPVRFIRIRVKETIDHNTNGYSHMSELSFWYSGLDFSY